VKVKFKPSISTDAAQTAAAAGAGGGQLPPAAASASGSAVAPPPQALQGVASDTREIFIGMFPSGKAVITGAVRWEEVRQSYEFARAVLCDHFNYLKVPVATGGPAGRKKAKRAAALLSARDQGRGGTGEM